VGHFERKFQTEGSVAREPLLVSKTRVIALSCVKITAVHCLVLSQIIIIIIIHTFLSRHKVVTSEAQNLIEHLFFTSVT